LEFRGENMPHRILIVDNDRTAVETVMDSLETEGFLVFSADTPEEGIDKARKIGPSLAFVNIVMPGQSGLHICKEIKNLPGMSSVPIIMLTIRDGAFDPRYTELFGIIDVLKKPLDRERVLETVHRHLEIPEEPSEPEPVADAGDEGDLFSGLAPDADETDDAAETPIVLTAVEVEYDGEQGDEIYVPDLEEDEGLEDAAFPERDEETVIKDDDLGLEHLPEETMHDDRIGEDNTEFDVFGDTPAATSADTGEPEPDEYPEDIFDDHELDAPRRNRPLFFYAGAGAVVLLALGAGWYFFSGDTDQPIETVREPIAVEEPFKPADEKEPLTPAADVESTSEVPREIADDAEKPRDVPPPATTRPQTAPPPAVAAEPIAPRQAEKPRTIRTPGFAVQVGAFRREAGARSIAGKLRQEGYPTEIIKGRRLYKVVVGPYENRADAVRTAKKFRAGNTYKGAFTITLP
jgi:DNA-binding response OmpR family regulator/cell division protein FtsN